MGFLEPFGMERLTDKKKTFIEGSGDCVDTFTGNSSATFRSLCGFYRL